MNSYSEMVLTKAGELMLDNGLSVMPVLGKVPHLISSGSKARMPWEPLKTSPMRLERLREFICQGADGIACIGGKVSGNLVCIDIDSKNDAPGGRIIEDFCAGVDDLLPGVLKKLVCQSTPSGGLHYIFRAKKQVPTKNLAKLDKKRVLIETRAEGAYFVCAPSPGYLLSQGSFETIPVLTDEETDGLLSVAISLNKYDSDQEQPVKQHVAREGDKSPLDDFDERTGPMDVLGFLEAHGWRRLFTRGRTICLKRPGKKERTISATIGHIPGKFYVFTTSTQFESGRSYSPAGVYAYLKHGGDFKAAAKELYDQGYGTRFTRAPEKAVPPVGHKGTAPAAGATPPGATPLQQTITGPGRVQQNDVFNPSSLKQGATLASEGDLEDGLLKLYHKPFYPGESTGWENLDKHLMIEKGQVNVISGVPGHGKSSLMDAICTNLALSKGWRTVFFSPENKTPEYHASKIVEIFSGKSWYGKNRIPEDQVKDASDFVKSHFMFLRPEMGGATVKDVLKHCVDLKPDVFVIDPWNRLNHSWPKGESETKYINDMLSICLNIAAKYYASIWLVVHPTKLGTDKNGNLIKPTLSNISGSANWANAADNGVIVWRDYDTGITEVDVRKVRFRHNGCEGKSYFQFDRSCGRFSPLENQRAADKMDWGACQDVHVKPWHTGTDIKSRAAGDLD